MSSERWQRIQELFEAALAQPAEARQAFIDAACGVEADLRDELRSLVFAHERSAGDERLPTQWLGPLAREDGRFETGDRVAGRYVIRDLLGRGGMGEVYEAWDEELSIPVALKVLRLQAGAGEALERLKHESLLARSVSHPNVCRVYDLSRHGAGTGAAWFLTMELLRGPTLGERLRDRGRLPLTQARPLAEQMAAALDAAHQSGVVHCDFKPANVMLVDRMGEQAVVTDFGLARAQSHRPDEAESSAIFGTPAYMAPEQMRGEEVGPAADIYALGIVLYEMVTGAVPFGGSGIEHARRRLESDPASPRTLVPELDERWEAVILRCLAREPRARFDRAVDVTRALAGWEPEASSRAYAGRSRPTLPAERDLFIGREAEVDALRQHFARGAHLVTLLGPAGMGKTRLAIRYGWQSRDEWTGGVWFADLTDARSEDGVAASVASSLGIQLGRGDPIQQLGDAIAGRGQCLVILDNFEPVLALAPTTLGRWLDRAQDARFLITSRERSSLSGEWIQSVGPLPPDRGRALFEARARWLRPGLELAGAEADAAQEVVRLAEGNPLAIELAAARMRVMSAEQLVVHMQKRFQLLTGGRGVRHETLAAAIDASWEGLCDWERAAWAQCAVFEGGFTLVAAEAVVDLSAMPAAPWIVDVIQSLVDKSLFRTWLPSAGPEAGVPQMRFGMFASMQDYARLKLRAEGASGTGGTAERAAEERHGNWYAGFGSDEAIAALDSKGGVERRRRLDQDLENLIAASRRALRDGRGEVAVASYRAAWAVLGLRGPYQTAMEIGRQLLARDDFEPLARALALTTLGQAEMRCGHMGEARARLDSALAVYRDLGNRRLEGSAHGDLASLYFELGQLKESRIHYETALAIARETGNRRLEGHALTNLGAVLATQGRMDTAESALEGALAIHREMGSRRFEGIVLGTLGMVRADQGRLDEARAHYEEALGIHREVGHRRFESIALVALGHLHLQQDRLDEAAQCYEAVRTAAREMGSPKLEGEALEGLGFVLRKRGRSDEAIAQFQAALDLHRRIGNRRAEGVVRYELGDTLHEQGKLAEARSMLAEAERIARENDDPFGIGKILCSRAELEIRAGNSGLAGRHLDEADRLAGQLDAVPGSVLRDMVAKVREMIAVSR